MKILTAHQPLYLPWLGLFHKIALADEFVYFDDVQYQDKDWNNRNRIQTHVGPLLLSIPVFNKNHYTLRLKDIMICEDTSWRKKHFKSIAIAYAKAAFAKRYLPFFEDLYSRTWEKLVDIDEHILRFILSELGIRTAFSRLSDLCLDGKKSDLVLEMCLARKADLYIFGAQGKHYADRAAFDRAGIRLEFQDYHHPVYPQLRPGFEPGLSVIDLLFNCGPVASLDVVMSGNLTREQLVSRYFSVDAVQSMGSP